MNRCDFAIHKWKHLYDSRSLFTFKPVECDKTSCVRECERCGTRRHLIDHEWIYNHEL